MNQSSKGNILDELWRQVLIAVVRAPDAEVAKDVIDVLIRSGIGCIEVTFTTPDAPIVIADAVARHPDAIIGAGTVVTPQHVTQALDAGAHFLVSPGTDPTVTAHMVDTGLAVMTGALTPTEIMQAQSLGVDVVKIFPGSLGGPGYLASLKGPFPDTKMMPTGGVSPDNASQWVDAGAFAIGAGSDLLPSAALMNRDWATVTNRARSFLDALDATISERSSR
jgi:2-dehydro-3-deoxyphosphogluconate aldolase/(4S)-4-hydroxy-2-oxoglutarate aldolase